MQDFTYIDSGAIKALKSGLQEYIADNSVDMLN